VRSSRENAERILRALNELGAEVDGLTIDDIAVNTQWDTPSGPIDILLTALGPNETVITFRELDRYSELIEIENGLLVPTSSLDDLIRMKEAADRVKDHQALPELRRHRGDSNPERSRNFDPFRTFQSTGTITTRRSPCSYRRKERSGSWPMDLRPKSASTHKPGRQTRSSESPPSPSRTSTRRPTLRAGSKPSSIIW
jgi:hypothetical protein